MSAGNGIPICDAITKHLRAFKFIYGSSIVLLWQKSKEPARGAGIYLSIESQPSACMQNNYALLFILKEKN